MAAVFRGENVLDPSIVRAIKVVRPELSMRPEFASRFAEEARILERLSHPNIVRFFGVRREQNVYLMELELLDGKTLSSAAAGNGGGERASLRDTVDWIRQAADGVAAAHALGVAHRDLKPDNCFLTAAGVVKVLDFGIARAMDEADRAAKMTVAGTVPGSPPYMAPEVCNGAVPAATADVYALALTLYELLAGFHPFMAPGEPSKSSTQLMFAHVTAPLPPLRSVRPDAPELLEQIIARGAAKDPAARYPSARELSSALASVVDRLPADGVSPPKNESHTQFALPQFGAASTTAAAILTTEGPAPASRSHGARIGAAIAALALVGGVFFFVRSRGSRDEHAAAPSPSAPSLPASPSAAAPLAVATATNPWVRIEPPHSNAPVILGLDSESALKTDLGFRPSRKIKAPSSPYEIQQHEVTWGELDPWLEASKESLERPSWTEKDASKRQKFPATAVPWKMALAYCKSLGASLPTEEAWEYAARGQDRRPYSWGADPIDLIRTHAYQGPAARLEPVMTNDQDATPGDAQHVLYDMTGNAMEWTSDLYREDLPSKDESWVQEGSVTYRAVRGLPLNEPAQHIMPAVGAAYRQSLCATGNCPKATAETLQYIGLRCTRRLQGGER